MPPDRPSQVIAREGQRTIRPGARVTLHFAILLADGREVDTTRRGKPATFTIGDGNVPGGFEAALMGLSSGDDERIPIPPERGFGLRREENVRTLPIADFREAEPLESGLVVAFHSPDGDLPGVVQEIRGNEVVVDFNHPLAGRDLIFDVTILRVE